MENSKRKNRIYENIQIQVFLNILKIDFPCLSKLIFLPKKKTFFLFVSKWQMARMFLISYHSFLKILSRAFMRIQHRLGYTMWMHDWECWNNKTVPPWMLFIQLRIRLVVITSGYQNVNFTTAKSDIYKYLFKNSFFGSIFSDFLLENHFFDTFVKQFHHFLLLKSGTVETYKSLR